jgi:hypothetical protein
LTSRDTKGICNLLLTWVQGAPLHALTSPAIASSLKCTTTHTAPEKSLIAALAVMEKLLELGLPTLARTADATQGEALGAPGHKPLLTESSLTITMASELVHACAAAVTTKAAQVIAGDQQHVQSLLEVVEASGGAGLALPVELADACSLWRCASAEL